MSRSIIPAAGANKAMPGNHGKVSGPIMRAPPRFLYRKRTGGADPPICRKQRQTTPPAPTQTFMGRPLLIRPKAIVIVENIQGYRTIAPTKHRFALVSPSVASFRGPNIRVKQLFVAPAF